MTAAIRRLQADRRISTAEIARNTSMSANYLNERLRDEKAFTLTDMEELGEYFGFEPGDFIVRAGEAPENVTPFRRRDVGAPREDASQEQRAASTDDSPIEEDPTP